MFREKRKYGARSEINVPSWLGGPVPAPGPAAGRENEQPQWNTIVCGTLRASRAQAGALLRKRKWVVNDGGVSLEGMAKVSQETNCVDCIYRFLFGYS